MYIKFVSKYSLELTIEGWASDIMNIEGVGVMENKNNGVLIGLVVVLVILVLGLMGYIVYDKGLIFNNENKVEENNKGNEVDNEEFVEHSVPTDMNLVSTKLNENGLNFYLMRVYHSWRNNGNLLNDSSNKLNLLNIYLARNDLTAVGCDYQCAVISLETYKDKYAEVYGSLDNFEYDTNNASAPVFGISDGYWDVPTGYVHWNMVWGVSSYNINLEATSVTYDENNNNYVISGNMMAIQDGSNIGSKGTFTITYVNDGTKNYLTGITITSTEN